MTEPAPAPLGRFLTLADVADVLAISARQAYGLVRSGELPAIQVGARGAWRVEQSVLEGYIQDKYDEASSRARWRQAQHADLPEILSGRRG
ncbi:MAG: helix-turn-helix domain-containing protein [Actinomycetales bacterium]|nr:helix-turn-helix domain-containing protein [Actinomycetales bacterium]